MSYFEDLTFYSYCPREDIRGFEVNVGWLGAGHPFPTVLPSEESLQSLWNFCKIVVLQMRGIHPCEFCQLREGWQPSEHHHQEYLLLGSAEIRVFSSSGLAYAAPNLIYHYVSAHHYAPPEEFLTALKEGPGPESDDYATRMEALGRDWKKRQPIDSAGVARVRHPLRDGDKLRTVRR